MQPDIAELSRFYASPLGLAARRVLTRRVRARWPSLRGLSLAGIGYATPLLRPYLAEAERVAALMPQGQGVAPWPAEGPHVSALVDEKHLPLDGMCFDRAILLHSLEHAEPASALLREVWRVLKPEGRLLLIAPNRRGLWAQREATPFGHGRPYSRGQIEKLLDNAMFEPAAIEPALFAPPLPWRAVAHAAPAWERAGAALWPMFGGVYMVEAGKRIYAGLREPAAVHARRALAADGARNKARLGPCEDDKGGVRRRGTEGTPPARRSDSEGRAARRRACAHRR